MVKVNFWPYKISNTRLLQATGQETMDITPQWRRLKWLGHVPCMEPTAHARTALSLTPEGRRKRGRPRTTWRRMILDEMKSAVIGWENAVRSAQESMAWQDLVEARLREVKVNTFNVLGGKPCFSFLCWWQKNLIKYHEILWPSLHAERCYEQVLH